MGNRFKTTFFLGSMTLFAFLFAGLVLAASEVDVKFPVAELGNCANKQECKTYCNAPEHIQSCVAFGKAHNLITKQEADRGEKFAKIATQAGPGGCKGQDECHAYCENMVHIEECVAFGEKHGLLSGEELNQAKKIAQALKRGVKPPSGCTSKQSCEAYCSEEGHFDECIAFGREAGFVSDDEYKIAKETQGKGPGDCRGKDQCEAYCQDEAHIKECVDFGRKHGFISEKDADIAIKTGGKGPGGCHADACKTYCENPDHKDECMNFAKEHGLISEEQVKQMEEGKTKFLESLAGAPPEVQACVHGLLGPDFSKQSRSLDMQKTPELASQIRACFEKQKHTEAQFHGPGGCATPEECKAYCSDAAHVSECRQFSQGNRAPEQGKRMMGRPPVGSHLNLQEGQGQSQTSQQDDAAAGDDYGESAPRMGAGDQHDPNSNDNEKACVEVITPARDPQTGACHEFPTPCAVPPGWEQVEACDEHADPNVAPPSHEGEKGLMPAGFHGPGGCSSQEECAAYCQMHPSECGIPSGPDKNASHPSPQMPPPPPAPGSPMESLQSLGAMALQAFLFLAGK